jgi:predicted CXXCH cytochrome family protein
MRYHAFVFGIVCAAAANAQPQLSVVDSVHNLSAGSTGTIRAGIEDQVCIFCHTPHHASAVRPLWNRLLPPDAYTVYGSRALDALPGQPTGESKMCLSCHDGTIALGSVISRAAPIPFAGGVTTLPAGATNLGTDLSDDHPLSFRFDATLVGKDPHLKSPGALPPEVRLDANEELQCTTCHDAHNNALGDFLVLQSTNSELCLSCHQIDNTSIVGHSDCAACHQPHTAPSGPYLLRRQTVMETCLTCHDGSHAGAPNIAPDMSKAFIHDTGSPMDPPGQQSEHVSCIDCHNPHTINPGVGTAPNIHPNFGDVPGVNTSGVVVTKASFEYEVCFQCHGDNNVQQPWLSRQIVQNNVRLEFDSGAVSYHPVTAPGTNLNVPSLVSGLTESSVIYCSDCHGTDTGGGSSPAGVHGSNFGPVLVARYETADFTTESPSVYALCYQCHDRNSLLNDESFGEHKKHIQGEDTSCATCHDSHGIASAQGNSTNNANLINFDTAVVFPNSQGKMEFIDLGTFRGECSLKCHGKDHKSKKY